MQDNYEDIIDLPHFEPKNHERMTKYNRASQFAAFQALTGYSDEVKETARLTNEKIEIDEGLKNILDYKLQIIASHIKEKPNVLITYFVADTKKSGGSYKTIIGNVKKIDSVNELIIMMNGSEIPICDILTITSDMLKLDDEI
jgi:hypothetical protein